MFVVAVVVTFRRDELLRRTLGAIGAQTRPVDHVLVVDNDHAGPAAFDGCDDVEVVRTGRNLGPAGGYALGFELALDRGADRLWPVDDDVLPEPTCLERLLAVDGDGAVIPLQRTPDGRDHFHPAWHGCLVAADAARAVGPPRADLFFWAEDTEFFLRLRRHGFEVREEPGAVVLDLDPGARPRRAARNWRLYYEVRNSLWLRIRVRGFTPRQLRKSAWPVLGKLAAILLLEPGKLRSLRLWWMGLRDFAAGRLGKLVDPDDFP